eukprot:1079240-Rhodomonas_salina.3
MREGHSVGHTIRYIVADTIGDNIGDTIGDTMGDPIEDTLGDNIGDTIGASTLAAEGAAARRRPCVKAVSIAVPTCTRTRHVTYLPRSRPATSLGHVPERTSHITSG